MLIFLRVYEFDMWGESIYPYDMVKKYNKYKIYVIVYFNQLNYFLWNGKNKKEKL